MSGAEHAPPARGTLGRQALALGHKIHGEDSFGHSSEPPLQSTSTSSHLQEQEPFLFPIVSSLLLLNCTSVPNMEESNPELESFRQQWRAEVSARTQGDGSQASKSSKAGPSKSVRRPPPITRLASNSIQKPSEEQNDNFGPPKSSQLDGSSSLEIESNPKSSKTEPESALEHYERAVERESQGQLGDSLSLYRKAYRVRRTWAISRYLIYLANE